MSASRELTRQAGRLSSVFSLNKSAVDHAERNSSVSALTIRSTITMNDGNQIPRLGFGVFQLDDPAVCRDAVLAALDAGYRHIDTALKYGNEGYVGNALAATSVPREDIFLTTKASFDQAPDAIRAGLADSLELLQTDYVDLFLIHWPMEDETLPGAWETLVELRETGQCRSIGVSNMSIRRFEEVFFPHTEVMPAVNQIELHVYNLQQKLVDYCVARGMVMEAYSSLAQGRRFEDPGQALVDIAEPCGKSVPQVMIRFLLQLDIVALVKSKTPQRISENADVFDFELTEEQMTALKALDNGLLVREWEPEGYY